MENFDKIAYREELKARLRRFALDMIELSKQTPFNSESKVLMNQLLRSGTSVYANYRASCRARSKAEFFSKLSIVVEEADETEMWLDLIIFSKINDSDLAKGLWTESLEILKIMAKARKNANP
ncbi:MAG: four helix bundle protein [Bacteroidota bacterium]|nr:four helix bundle protein [Odoribacter sp.]MDP3642172.1 four helix bundle protein [Bacteroidota bacterium]